MDIEYFEFGNYGWGQIFRRSINTNDKNYVSHTDDTVTFADSFMDIYDEVQHHDVTMPRKFSAIRDQLLTEHKKRISDLQKEVSILEASDSFENYKPF